MGSGLPAVRNGCAALCAAWQPSFGSRIPQGEEVHAGELHAVVGDVVDVAVLHRQVVGPVAEHAAARAAGVLAATRGEAAVQLAAAERDVIAGLLHAHHGPGEAADDPDPARGAAVDDVVGRLELQPPEDGLAGLERRVPAGLGPVIGGGRLLVTIASSPLAGSSNGYWGG
ncbi:MAG: hypothetical protein WKG00_17455 [Polyangiaceae bacterium]